MFNELLDQKKSENTNRDDLKAQALGAAVVAVVPMAIAGAVAGVQIGFKELKKRREQKKAEEAES